MKDLTFIPNGAPTHSAIAVRQWLNEHFPERWLG